MVPEDYILAGYCHYAVRKVRGEEPAVHSLLPVLGINLPVEYYLSVLTQRNGPLYSCDLAVGYIARTQGEYAFLTGGIPGLNKERRRRRCGEIAFHIGIPEKYFLSADRDHTCQKIHILKLASQDISQVVSRSIKIKPARWYYPSPVYRVYHAYTRHCPYDGPGAF